MKDDTVIASNRVFGLDLMRAVAIIMVLCSHILWIYPPNTNSFSQIAALFGFWGVELFFVLSGFLIGKIIYKSYISDDFNLKQVFYFLQRRWFRTLPAYYFVLILNIIITYVLDDISLESWRYFLFLQNFHTTMLAYFPESWSLSVEEYSYLVLPFALLIVTNLIRPTNKSKRFLCIVLLLITILTLTKIWYYFTTSNTTLNQWNLSLKAVVLYRIDAILYGVFASWIAINHFEFWIQKKISLAILSCFCIILMYVGVGYFDIKIVNYPFFWNVLYLPLTSIIFALSLPLLSQWRTTVRWILIPITFISTISYSIYLLHYSVILQILKHYFRTENQNLSYLHTYTLIYLIITFILAWLFYNFYEKPMMNLRK